MVLCFLFFHRLSAGSFIYLNDGSGNFGNLNMNGECIVRLYFLCFGYDCILLFDCRDTRRYARVFLKNSASFFLFVFPSLFSFRFPGYQRDDRVLIRHS